MAGLGLEELGPLSQLWLRGAGLLLFPLLPPPPPLPPPFPPLLSPLLPRDLSPPLGAAPSAPHIPLSGIISSPKQGGSAFRPRLHVGRVGVNPLPSWVAGAPSQIPGPVRLAGVGGQWPTDAGQKQVSGTVGASRRARRNSLAWLASPLPHVPPLPSPPHANRVPPGWPETPAHHLGLLPSGGAESLSFFPGDRPATCKGGTERDPGGRRRVAQQSAGPRVKPGGRLCRRASGEGVAGWGG